MSQPIPTQHPAVVLRSHYTHLRILLAIAMTAVIGLSVAVVIVAGDDGPGTSATTAVGRSEAAGTVLVVPPPQPTGRRYDGGPEEGSRGIATQATRYDGGPDEGTRGIATQVTRNNGSPDALSLPGEGWSRVCLRRCG